jgi:alkyldihydroxyacetonephosphate synthase
VTTDHSPEAEPADTSGPMRPTPPIELTGTGSHLATTVVEVSPAALAALHAACPSSTAIGKRAEASRDWWPLAMHWALVGQAPQVAAIVCSPTTTDEVVAVLRVCHEHRVPVTPAAGRSGVTGASVPVFGGVLLDLANLHGVVHLDEVSGVVEVVAGTFGPDLEREIGAHGHSVGHFPQSFDLATVGGWVACRGAGQYSTRYGKIEDMVVGLEVVLADGTVVRTGGAPAAAAGPDLTQLFVGSEGTLGVVTRVWLRTHAVSGPPAMASYAFDTFEAGIDACRRIIQRGATPAVLRLYDAPESARGQGGDGTQCMLLVLDEGDHEIVDATMRVVAAECATAVSLGVERVERWTHHRNDTSALQALTRKGFVVDTLEIAAPWAVLGDIFDAVRTAMLAVPHARAATCHLSHSYPDGACLYFTFAATPPADEVESTYIALWDAGTRAVLAHGGNLSHHHGVGLNRSRYVREALGPAFDVLVAMKHALDPTGILNPGKLGLPSPFGEVRWP